MSPRLLALIPLAVAINLALGQLAAATSLPLFLDAVGTVLVACLTGLAPALVTGTVSQVVMTMYSGNGTWLAFLPVQPPSPRTRRSPPGMAGFVPCLGLLAGLGLGVTAALISWPISYLAFGGVTAGGVTIVTTLLTGLHVPLQWAVLAASLSNDLLDKTVTFALIRTILVSLPRRVLARYPAAARALAAP